MYVNIPYMVKKIMQRVFSGIRARSTALAAEPLHVAWVSAHAGDDH
jgi:hypothetical protein